MFNVIDRTSGFKIDFIIKKETAFQRSEFSRRQRGDIWGINCWIISLEDLILAKLIWIQDLYSERQAADISNLLIDNVDMDFSYIQHWIGTLSLNTYHLI